MTKLLLSKDIYKTILIDETAIAFSNLAKISLYDDGSYIVCLFENCVYSKEQTIKEFENYLIDLSNKMEY